MSHGIQITQKELAEVADLERRSAALEERLNDLKQKLLPLLLEGFPVEPGRYDAHAVKRIGRSIPWKQLVLNELGAEAAERFRKQFPVHVYFELAVVEHAVPPLWKGISGGVAEQE